MRFLITGTAGFIGFHLAKRLLDEGHRVVGIDGFTPYYDPALKAARHRQLEQRNGFRGHRVQLEDADALAGIWAAEEVDILVHLAAQAGVRYSLENPRSYLDSNLVGTFNILELTRRRPVEHLLLASTSSVYGVNAQVPFRETDRADYPVSLYAATKKATELMAHAHAHAWNVPTTAFRFFTVYGAWGRPDMAPSRFAKGITDHTPIEIYNNGDMLRDFTYIEDLVEGIIRLSTCVPERPQTPAAIAPGDSLSPVAPFRVVNIGTGKPVRLLDFIELLEEAFGTKAERVYKPMQMGDVPRTFASVDLLEHLTGYRPSTPTAAGIRAFADWYRDYYGV
jgi:UDP-glucuronate 4-epimerase